MKSKSKQIDFGFTKSEVSILEIETKVKKMLLQFDSNDKVTLSSGY